MVNNMIPATRQTARKTLDTQLTRLKGQMPERPPKGWVRAIRDSFGMTAAQLAARLGISQPSVVDLERREARCAVSLNALAAAARALDCTLVYALVPNDSLDATVRRRAREVAARRLARVSHSMRLEMQGLSEEANRSQLDQLVEDILRNEMRVLWLEK